MLVSYSKNSLRIWGGGVKMCFVMSIVASIRSHLSETALHLHARNLLGARGGGYPFVKYKLLIDQDAFTALGKDEIDEIKDVCRRRFGSAVYYPYMALYKTFDQIRPGGGALKDWMPTDFFNRRVLPKINHDYRGISRIKTLSKRLMGSDCLPDIGYILGGRLFDGDMEPVSPLNFVSAHQDGCSVVYIKADDSNSGHGVLRTDLTAINDALIAEIGADCVIQSQIDQHAWFEEFCPGSSATIRINTLFYKSDRPRKIGATLRLPAGGDKYTSGHGQRVGIAVRDDDGNLDEFALDNEWKLTTTHPDSGLQFSGRTIPHFRDAVEMCETLHRRLPHIGLIGWDVGIDATGAPKIMEWNAHSPGLEKAEMTTGPMFSGFGFEEAYR